MINKYLRKEKQREYDHARWASQTPEQREKARERLRKWQAAHRERTRESTAKYRALHLEENRENARKQRLEKPEQVKAAIRDWQARNPDKVKEYRRRWEHETPGGREYRRQKYNRKRDRRRSAEGRYTKADIDQLFTSQMGLCAACNTVLATDGPNRFHVDHIIPLRPNTGPRGTNDPSNLQLLCPPCNMSKSNLQPHEWRNRSVAYA